MIKFFRKIRQRLLTENKLSKYFIYAIGEIILVVIGILIALQINNWNEDRKKGKLKIEYLVSLKRDLEFDIAKLNTALDYVENDLKKNNAFSKRLSSPKANIDTLVKIARYEFNPIVGGLKELNKNTYNSLISTGNIDLLGKEFTDKIQEHYTIQETSMFFIKTNFQSYIDGINQYVMQYPINIKQNAINGPLQDSFWKNINKHHLQSNFNGVLSGRIFAFNNEKLQIIILLEKTQELLMLIQP